ncbi:hypothetical protein BASA81_006736 [Batrachochytrium salamandrivorans]|nr:hypothetical protein BASA81_006736 [Batrachochytrium salamandrivorans]
MLRLGILVGCLVTTIEARQRFIVLGDWGSEEIAKVAPHMLGEVDSDTEAVLLLGDNFYPVGTSNANDPQFASIYQVPFQHFPPHLPFQVIAGNHDYYSNIQSQLTFTNRDRRWYFPSLYYSRAYGKVLTINLDTYGLVGGESNFGGTVVSDREQLLWIENELKTRAHLFDWVVVMGHYPIYSCNEGSDTIALENELFPLLVKYKVDLYLSGHIHLQQHVEKLGVNMFVSGNGARYIPRAQCQLGVNRDQANVLLFTENSFGFIVLDFTSHLLQAKFHRISIDGSEHSVVYEMEAVRMHKLPEQPRAKYSYSLRQSLLNRLRTNRP